MFTRGYSLLKIGRFHTIHPIQQLIFQLFASILSHRVPTLHHVWVRTSATSVFRWFKEICTGKVNGLNQYVWRIKTQRISWENVPINSFLLGQTPLLLSKQVKTIQNLYTVYIYILHISTPCSRRFTPCFTAVFRSSPGVETRLLQHPGRSHDAALARGHSDLPCSARWGAAGTDGEWKLQYPIGSMYGTYANIWGILMVNVAIYGIHGESWGYPKKRIYCNSNMI